MTAGGAPPLYNREILALAVDCVRHPRLERADVTVAARAPLCGSAITLDLGIDAAGRIIALGMLVQACALGQAAAALFARHAPGQRLAALAPLADDVAGWLALSLDDAAAAPWPGLALLAAARPFPARHGAIILPFRAAAMAADQTAAAASASRKAAT